jgi:hypothetical protein
LDGKPILLVYLTRKLDLVGKLPTVLELILREARTLVDVSTQQNLLMVNSFNEFHEGKKAARMFNSACRILITLSLTNRIHTSTTDTQIEPCIGIPTSLPQNLTNGMVYKGYGELYLQILRRETVLL